MPAPANDTQANATLLDSEFGSLTAQTTVGSTSETSPTVINSTNCPGYVSNGHDVWFKWRLAWILSTGTGSNSLVRYLLWTQGAGFKHTIRVYYKATYHAASFSVYTSKDRFSQTTTGLNQVLQMLVDNYNYAASSFTDWMRDTYIYVQVDSAESSGETGTFDLHWGRSSRPNIGNLLGFAAFVNPRDRKTMFIGGLNINDVSKVMVSWYQAGRALPAGWYRVQYAGGAYQIAGQTGDPFNLYDANFEILYNDGVSPHDGVSSFANVLGGPSPNQVFSDIAQNTPEICTFTQRFTTLTFWHAGGKIGLQFRDYYSAPFWVAILTLPNYLGYQVTTPERGWTDNRLLSPMAAACLWRLRPKLKFVAVTAAFIGTPSATPTTDFYILNDTSLDLTGAQAVQVYKKVNGVPTEVSTNNFSPYSQASMALHIDMSVMPVVQTLYCKLPLETDVMEFPVVFDFTPKLEAYTWAYYGIVMDGGVQKWSCQVRFRNKGLGPWLHVPSGELVAGGRAGLAVSYPNGQALGPFQFNDAYLNFYVAPPAGVTAAAFSFRVKDSGWTSPLMTVTIEGDAVSYGVAPSGGSGDSGGSSSGSASSSS